MRPIIGLTCKVSPEGDNFLHPQYIQAIESAGGVPILIPCLEVQESIEQLSQKIDGLLLSGGGDIDPARYNESPHPKTKDINPQRDSLELILTKLVLKRGIPVLAICRGMQILNIVEGGTLNQHINGHYQTESRPTPTHEIEIKTGTLLFKIIGQERIRVNSFHHQLVRDVATGYRVSAVAKDGVIEAMESETHHFILGVQFHTEHLWQANPLFKNIFLSFVKACQK
ncbi:MAG: gamma-glutamyl-gamma-aminobutyrate hydrolase family protein [Candidatus Stahlbacteria bacterium]|nr:gamma-glutamyl-gamma-aminobutyrate hydrolase family protein [Candidatus Stahlbacteria bacterium]